MPGYTLVDAALKYDLAALDRRLKGGDALGLRHQSLRYGLLHPGFYWNSVIYGTKRTVYGTLAYRW